MFSLSPDRSIIERLGLLCRRKFMRMSAGIQHMSKYLKRSNRNNISIAGDHNTKNPISQVLSHGVIVTTFYFSCTLSAMQDTGLEVSGQRSLNIFVMVIS